MSFTGSLRVKVVAATGLRPTDYQKRHDLNFGKNNDKKDLDPYVSLNVDEKFIGEWRNAMESFKVGKISGR
jgi:ribosome modulation factor